MTPLSTWLQTLGLERYAPVFAEHEVDLEAMRLLSETDLERLGLQLGARRKLLKAIAQFDAAKRVVEVEGESTDATGRSTVATLHAERRQLTVLFCDLVGSTELSRKLDPEDLREVMRGYQKAVRQVVERYEGHIAQYLGDGLMVYFGWPRAHEDDAVRAIRAGLEAVEAVSKLPALAIQARAGLHTGLVVVGETGGGDASVPNAAVGDTPNIAARLQGLADAGCVVVTERTQALATGLFDFVDQGAHALKGIPEPVRVFRVRGVSAIESRFDAARSGGAVSPLIGREEELGLLMRRWAQAKAGEGQVVLIGGEPGIGKSRLTRALRERIEDESHIALRYQCSPYHLNSALHPVIEHIERTAGFAREDTPDHKLDKLQALLGSRAQIAEAAPLFATLLSLPTERYPPLKLSPQKQKEKTLDALAGHIEALARRQPLLMMFEDVHWIDPTSQESLDVLLLRLQTLPILLVVTHRPEYTSAWVGQHNVVSLMVNRLGRRQGTELVAKLTGGKGLPAEVLEQIVAHTDGIPLFVEELTKSVLESKLLREEGDRYVLNTPVPALAIPTTLRDSLVARLDRLAPIREIAQIGACIGREFSHDLLAEVSPLKGVRLDEALEQLTQTGLVFRRGTPPDAIYTFKHALVQDAAYDSLLRSRRSQLHAEIAQALERDFSDRATNEPEVLARHFTQAGMPGQAVPYLILAGRRALRRVALAEAVGHLNAALSVGERLPPSEARDVQELDIRILLGTAYLAYLGWSAVEVVQALGPARDLAVRLHEDAKLIPILWFIWQHHAMRCEYPNAQQVVEELGTLARSSRDSTPLLIARMTEALTHGFKGDFEQARQALDRLLAAYNYDRHRHLVYIYNLDPKCGTLLHAGYWLWALGFPDQARQAAVEQLELVRRLGHPFHLCWSLTGGTQALWLRGEIDLMREWLAEARAVAQEHGLAYMAEVPVRGYDAVALIEQGKYAESYAEAAHFLRAWRSAGGVHSRPTVNLLQGQALTALGRFDEARAVLDEAVGLINQTGHRMSEAEAHRALGELQRQQPTPDIEGAATSFLKALEVARSQEAKGFELRAAISLARLWSEHGKQQEAYDLLVPVYDWFTEGFDTKDLKEAKALLDSLDSGQKLVATPSG